MKFSASTKGVPQGGPYSLDQLGASNWNILRQDVPLPVAILKKSALQTNSRVMHNYLTTTGASIAPHGKTTMSPELFEQQLRDGAWGLTAATTAHVQTYIDAGVQRIFFANQLVGKQNAEHALNLLTKHKEVEFFCLVDSIESIELLRNALHAFPISLNVLLEVGVSGGRTGVRSLEQGITIAQYLQNVPEIRLVGVESFEGIFGSRDSAENVSSVQSLLRDVVRLAEAIHSRDWFDTTKPLLSAGGSAYFDLVVAEFSKTTFSPQVLLRSGCYLTQDHGLYKPLSLEMQNREPRLESFTQALEVWGCVQSLPEPGLAIVNLGKRDISYDVSLPIPIHHLNSSGKLNNVERVFQTTKLNDQHAFIQIPAEHPIEVGDLLGFGIAHPCTTFDKWRMLYVVTDDYTVVDAIHTCF